MAGAISAGTIKLYILECQGKWGGVAFIPTPGMGRVFPLSLIRKVHVGIQQEMLHYAQHDNCYYTIQLLLYN